MAHAGLPEGPTGGKADWHGETMKQEEQANTQPSQLIIAVLFLHTEYTDIVALRNLISKNGCCPLQSWEYVFLF